MDDEAISPRQPAPSIEHAMQTAGPTPNRLNHLDMRADPDAQATVSDFLDFTEYLPADITRSLTLIGKLDETYVDASAKVHELTTLWGQLPHVSPTEEKRDALELRADTSENLHHALNSRIFSLAEAQRMAENVNRHYVRARTILAKLETMLENYPTAEEQKSPVATKSPQLSRSQKMPLRVDGQKLRRPRVPRITVPGEVLAPYELNYDAYTTGTESSSEDDEDDEDGLSSRLTPAPPPRIKVVKTGPRHGRPGRPPRPRTSVPPPNPALAGLSTSAAMAQLTPPPANAVIGGPDAPWGQLTPYELARLRKRMKKNAAWTPSDTMVARELSALGRGVEAFRAAKQQAEAEGRVFEGQMPVPTVDPDTGEKRMPLGALTMETLASDEKSLSNRGMKLNEAKKLKRELLAKMAAEEAEESARRFDAIARTLMSDATPTSIQDPSQSASKVKAPRKRKRDSAPDGDTEKLETVEGPAQRPQIKRTKTETPVPPPVLTPAGSQGPFETPGQTSQRTSAAGILHSTTPIPIPIHSQEQSITAKSATSAASAASPASSYAGQNGAPTLGPVKLPATETPIPPPIISPKKSMTPILPPPRETRKTLSARAQEQQQLDARAAQVAMGPLSRSASPAVAPKPEPDAPGAAAVSTPAASTTTVTRRPGSRGKAASQEPPPSLAADRPRRASTARNTPAPERADQAPAGTAANPAAAGATAAAGGTGPGGRPANRRGKRPAPGIISRTNSGGNSAVGMRKAAPRKKSAATRAAANKAAAAKDKAAGADAGGAEVLEVEVDDEGNLIDPNEPRYCLCNRVSFGTMIQCDNLDNCKGEWFHLECVGLADIPARTTKWYCPDCRKLLNIGEKGEVSARGVKA
ncbi:dc316667-ddf1-4253-af83-7854241940c8 [Thermothielavioides terrestris]|uniref:Dc316667-ddf1-4253-af83-7854241940c8 n=1 Tax=Thermothielavioides terrestris TaxID=2587410 RepID=A0A3S4ANU8_9PEZI|nr:dc316667-ddf1-4253-af83-7854241940c8 [Thermothielavioides terrestris]